MAGFYGRDILFQPTMQKRMEDMKYSKGRYSLVGAGLYEEFIPPDLPGLVDWHRSDLGVTLVGNKVSAWADQSGLGHHLTQNTDADRGIYQTNYQNGLPAIDFDLGAIGGFMSWTAWTMPVQVTAFMIVRYTTKATLQLGMGLGSTSTHYLGGGAIGVANRPFIYSGTAAVANWNAALVNNEHYLIKWKMDRTVAAACDFRTQVNNAPEVQQTAAGTTSEVYNQLGYRSQDLVSKVFEIFIYNRLLLPDEELKLWIYTQKRYRF